MFDLFIYEFRTYEPILSDVKREYEICIANQQQDLRQFEILKSKLSVAEFRMAKEIQKVQYEYGCLLEEKSNEICDMHEQLTGKTMHIVKLEHKIRELEDEVHRSKKPSEVFNINKEFRIT